MSIIAQLHNLLKELERDGFCKPVLNVSIMCKDKAKRSERVAYPAPPIPALPYAMSKIRSQSVRMLLSVNLY